MSERITAGDIGEGFTPARSPDVYAVEIDGEAVLLDEAADRLHVLNRTGALVWNLFDGHTAIAQLASDLAAELGAPSSVVCADLVAIARHLGDEGLLMAVDPTPPPAEATT